MQQNNIKQSLIFEIEKRVQDKILEPTNAKLLEKLINNADSSDEAIQIAALGTTYKRTGLHFDKKLEKLGNTIKYFKKNEKLSFHTDYTKPANKLIIGDNYDALQNLLIEYKAKINVIYIDPPYGKDSMGEFAKTNYENAITRDNLLSMLYPRLTLAKELLSDDGVIFCSIDDKNQAYIKCLFDEVFGEENFVATLIWANQEGGGSSDSKYFKIKHEYIICFTKDINNCNPFVNVDIEDYDRYKLSDEYENERGKYQLVKLASASIQYSKTLDYEIVCPDGSKISPAENSNKDKATWRWSKQKLQKGIDDGFVEFKKDKNNVWQVYTKQYLNCDKDGNIIKRTKKASGIIMNFSSTQGSNQLFDIFYEKKFGYPKPFELISWLIGRFEKNDSIILDFFAGSGTTGHAVLDLNEQDGGNRTFILCQLNEKTSTTPNGIAYDVTSKRLKRIMTGSCYDGSTDFAWNKNHKSYGGNLDVYEIAEVSNFESVNGKTPFEVIDETLYGKEKFSTIKEKIEWICSNFDKTQKYLEEK